MSDLFYAPMIESTVTPSPVNRALRNVVWLALSLVLLYLVYQTAPHLVEVLQWKLLQVTSAAYVGYWIGRTMFFYARPHYFLQRNQPFLAGVSMACNTLIVALTIWAVCFGL